MLFLCIIINRYKKGVQDTNMSKYILKKMFVDGDRNVYFPRTEPYDEHELPEKCRTNSEYCTEVGGSKAIIIENIPQQVEETKEIKLVEYSKTKETNMTPKIQKIAEVEKININTAPAEKIMDIKGIAEKLATKIVESREKDGIYTSIEDLNSRVPVSFGGNWEKYKNIITF